MRGFAYFLERSWGSSQAVLVFSSRGELVCFVAVSLTLLFVLQCS